MLKALKQRREDEGFTLIELMVVVLIIAILLAIAIPTFLGAQDRARDRAAQSNLRNGLTAAKTIATDFEGFFRSPTGTEASPVAMLSSELQAAEQSLVFGAAASDTTIGVAVDSTVPVGEDIMLVKASKSGAVFGLKATKDGVVTYCKSAKGAATPLSVSSACTDTKW